MEQNNALIIVKQLPIIAQNLAAVKKSIDERTQRVKNLVCTDATLKDVKKIRAEMGKELTAFELERKKVKSEIMRPYEEFEKTYRECIADAYKSADATLKWKIGEVENGLKAEREAEIKAYFDDKRTTMELDFVPFDRAGLKIGLTGSMSAYKKTVDGFLERLKKDMDVISSMEDSAEIITEYKRTYDLATSISTVKERKAAIAAEKAHAEAKAAETANAEETYVTPTPESVEGLLDFDGLPDPENLLRGMLNLEEPIPFEKPGKWYNFHVCADDEIYRAVCRFLNDNKIDWWLEE